MINRTAEEPVFAVDGTQLFRYALDETALRRVAKAVTSNEDRPGTRVFALNAIADFTAVDGVLGGIAASLHGQATRPVRAILFDKRADLNWSLGLHQDRTIAVTERIDVPGYGPWSVKGGQHHVQPPPDIIAGMVTLRIHLDDVDADNAPFLILRGTHDRGQLSECEIDALSSKIEPFACQAKRGDVWAYGTAIIHGSAVVRRPGRRRRVLQIDYARDALPGGLAWAFGA